MSAGCRPVWLTILFGFSTQILWVTTRGGVWHTGHLIATILTFACLIELWGRQRAWLIGLLAGAAFLTRAPLAFAIPFYALLLTVRRRGHGPRFPAVCRASADDPVAVVGLAGARRAAGDRRLLRLQPGPLRVAARVRLRPRDAAAVPRGPARSGLFSLAHIPMNLDYFLVHLPRPIPDFPFFRPDGLGMSVLLTSPGLLFAFRADWRDARAWWLLGATVAVLIPTLLYYGGGWLQYGYRYFLDSVPFVIALCGLAAVRRGRVGRGLAGADRVRGRRHGVGVYWAYNLR